MLLHGFGAETVWQWSAQARVLARDHRVIVPNLLWFGRSESANRDFTLDHQVAVIQALLDHLQVEQADVVGISYGGIVTWGLANVDDRVRRAVIVDSPGTAYTDDDYAALLQRFDLEELGPLLVPPDAAAVKTLMQLAYHRPPAVPKAIRQQVVDELYATHRDEKVALLETVVGQMDELRSRARDLDVPTLLIWGDQDPVFPLEIAHRLQQRTGAELHVIKNGRHAPNLEHAAEFNRVMLEFLRK